MEDHFSPKQVAEALKVSESSVKRWCDLGALATSRTHGGHRRIALDGLMAFLESTNREISDPSAIGMGSPSDLPSTASTDLLDLLDPAVKFDNDSLRQSFEESLLKGDERECRRLLIQAYKQNHSFAKVADQFIAATFHRIGELWHEASIEVFQERRACELCNRLAHEFRRLMIEPSASAPLAIGCTLSGDHYSIPGMLIEIVLREAGWRASNIGSNLPFDSLAEAVRREQPKLVWLSVSYAPDRDALIRDLNAFSESIPSDTSLIVGGRVLCDDVRPKLKYTAHCDTFEQLSTLAKTLRNNSVRKRKPD